MGKPTYFPNSADPASGAPEFAPHLKEIAGRIQKLSYREMQQLSDMIAVALGCVSDQTVAVTLLEIADKIGGTNNTADAPTLHFPPGTRGK